MTLRSNQEPAQAPMKALKVSTLIISLSGQELLSGAWKIAGILDGYLTLITKVYICSDTPDLSSFIGIPVGSMTPKLFVMTSEQKLVETCRN